MIVERFSCGPMQYNECSGGEDDWCISNDDSIIVFGGLDKEVAERLVVLLNLGAAAEALTKETRDADDLVEILIEKTIQLQKAKEYSMWLDDSGQGEGDESVQHTKRADDIFRAAKSNVLNALLGKK